MFKRATSGAVLAALVLPFLLFMAPAPGQVALREGDALAAAGRYGAALGAYERARTQAPWAGAALVRAGELRLRLGEFDDAVATFRQAVSLQPGSCANHAGLGRALAAQGQQAEAAATLHAVAGRCRLAEPAFEAGELYLELGQLAAAEESFGRALAAAAPVDVA
ncbi:MAG: tetratricopeptide repeat protein, partial [Chloroflexota bacterium]